VPEIPAMIHRRICQCDECGKSLTPAQQHIVRDDTGKFPVCQECKDKYAHIYRS
jgi:RNase P subunit RPR2